MTVAPLKVSAVVVNWNGAEHLEACVDSVLAQSVTGGFELIVVDNASTDGSIALLGRYGARVRILRNSANAGYAAACNQAIAASSSEFVAVFNNDTVVFPGCLEAMARAMDREERTGLCAAKVLSYHDRSLFDTAGHVVYRDGLTRGRGRLEQDRGQYDRLEEVFCASGAAAMLRRSMLDRIGGFDDDFFAYCEDADLGFRARLAGWTCVYVPEALVLHRFSASTDAYSEFKAYHVERNRVWLAVKNLPLPMLLVSPFATMLRYAWQAFGALSGKGAAGRFATASSRAALAGILIRALRDSLRGMPLALRKRRRVQRLRVVGMSEVRRWFREYGISARGIALMD